MPQPIHYDSAGIGLGSRVVQSVVVAASPTAATETTICTLTVGGDLAYQLGVVLLGFAAFTVGTNGTATRLRIRQTNTAGTVVADTGATTGGIAAANLVDMNVAGTDVAPGNPQVYVLTLTVTAGSAASTVSNVQLLAIAV